MYDVIIIGAGCAGLTAGIYCGRAELKTLIFAGNIENKGGLLVKTSIVENYPGFPDGILGYDLIHNMELQAVKTGVEIINQEVTAVDLEKKTVSSGGKIFSCKVIIIATGSKPNKLNLPDEDRLWAKGISSCAVCDGALYKRKRIVVVGGGDSAMEEASFLTKFSNVTLIHRGASFTKASKAMITRVLNDPKIKVIYDTIITKLIGNEFLEEITLKNIKTEEETTMKVDGLFYGLGLTPNTELFDDDVKNYLGYLDKNGLPKGVYAAGDAQDSIYRQAIVAAGDGCKAAMKATNYIHNLEK